MYASIEEFFNCLHDACASGLPRSLVNRFIVTEQTASTFRYFGRNCGVCGKFYPFPSSQREAAIKGIKELDAILDIKCATLRWDESNDGLTIKGTKRMEKEIERCGWSRIRYVIRRKRRGGEAKQSVERSGIAIFRDGAWREESVGKGGGERKVGSTWSVNAHIVERMGTLSNTLRRFFYVGAFRVPLRCRIIRELCCKNLYSSSRKLYRGIHDDKTRI